MTRVEGARLIKSDIFGDSQSSSNRVPLTVTFVLQTVAKENTFNRLSSQFGAFMRVEKNKIGTTKQA